MGIAQSLEYFRIHDGVEVDIAGEAAADVEAGHVAGAHGIEAAIDQCVGVGRRVLHERVPGSVMLELFRADDELLRQLVRLVAGHVQQFQGIHRQTIEVNEPIKRRTARNVVPEEGVLPCWEERRLIRLRSAHGQAFERGNLDGNIVKVIDGDVGAS